MARTAPVHDARPAGGTRLPPALALGFPRVVDEVSARLVAAGAAALAVTYVASGWTWVLAVLAYGFVARVLAGPRLSPLALLVTRVVRPRWSVEPRLVPGPPKRFAQGIGAVLSSTALVLDLAGADTAARAAVAALLVAATLEAVLGLCLGCVLFARLIRWGLVPASVCAACADLSLRTGAGAVRE